MLMGHFGEQEIDLLAVLLHGDVQATAAANWRMNFRLNVVGFKLCIEMFLLYFIILFCNFNNQISFTVSVIKPF